MEEELRRVLLPGGSVLDQGNPESEWLAMELGRRFAHSDQAALDAPQSCDAGVQTDQQQTGGTQVVGITATDPRKVVLRLGPHVGGLGGLVRPVWSKQRLEEKTEETDGHSPVPVNWLRAVCSAHAVTGGKWVNKQWTEGATIDVLTALIIDAAKEVSLCDRLDQYAVRWFVRYAPSVAVGVAELSSMTDAIKRLCVAQPDQSGAHPRLLLGLELLVEPAYGASEVALSAVKQVMLKYHELPELNPETGR